MNLLLNGRSYTQLVLLSPGAIPNPGARLRSDGVNINGNRALQNNFLIDGLDNNNYLFAAGGSGQAIRPSVDAIQEFKVETANYGAEYGRAAGGVISVVIKSGSNAVHGSGFEFFRHERLEANDFFADRGGLAKPPLRYHQFGGTSGGPIVHNRAFFFGSYQGTRERRTCTATITVPTPEMLRGEFGAVVIYDPLTSAGGMRQPFPNNTIPPERLDPVGRRIAQFFAAPNRPAPLITSSAPCLARTTAIRSTRGSTFRSPRGRICSPVTVSRMATSPRAASSDRQATDTRTSPRSATPAVPLLLKKNTIYNLPQSRGEFTFRGQFTSQVPGQSSGSGLADLLLGQTSIARLSTPLSGDFRDRYFAGYASDTWKLARDVTLTLGARYEVQTPMWERENRMTNFDGDPRSPTFGTLVSAAGGDIRARTFTTLDLNNLGPRVGATWSISPATAMRGAYGMFYGGLGYQAAALTDLANVPYFVRATLRSAPVAAKSVLVLGDGFQPDALDPAKVSNPDAFSLASELSMAQVHQWNVSVERWLMSSTSLIVTYVGSVSAELRGINNINAPIPGPGPIQERRPFPAFGEILEASSFVEASYHAVQVSAERRLHDGTALLASYTWGHAIDSATDPGDTAMPIAPQNRADVRGETASAIFDVRHRFATSAMYESPVGARRLLRGWRAAGIFIAQTGYPLTPTIRPNSSISTTVLRPDCVGDGNLPRSERTTDRWFNVAAFKTPAPFTFGNCGRNVLRGPGYVHLDLLVGHEFRFGGDKRLELRAEVFNVANAVHLGPPNTVIDVPSQAGRITSTQAPPRQAQLGVRFVF